jgi:hypothetical protein
LSTVSSIKTSKSKNPVLYFTNNGVLSQRAFYLEVVKERVPVEDQPVGREKAEAAQEGERDGRAEPVASYERQRAEPILKIKTFNWNL